MNELTSGNMRYDVSSANAEAATYRQNVSSQLKRRHYVNK